MPGAIDSPPAPAPAPAVTPSPAPSPGGEAPFNDAFADLDKLVGEPEAAAPPEKPEKPAGLDKPEKKPAEPADKKSAEPTDKKPAEPADKKGSETTGRRSPWQIVHDKEAEIATLRKQLSERDAAKPNTDWQKERADLLKRIEERDARLKEREQALEYTAFEKSDKFKSEYQKPYENAWNQGRSTVARFKVTDSDGNARTGTPEDFDRLMTLEQSDPEKAAELMAEMFGPKASYVASHIVEVKKAFQRMQDAREDFGKRGEEDRLLKSQQTEKETRELAEVFDTWRNAAVEKYPDIFKATDDDAEGKGLLDKGEHLANRVFSSGQPIRDGDKPLTKQEKSALDAVAWQKIRAFDFQVTAKRRAEARVKELEKELEQYKQSEPGPSDGGGRKPAGDEIPDWDKQLESLAT